MRGQLPFTRVIGQKPAQDTPTVIRLPPGHTITTPLISTPVLNSIYRAFHLNGPNWMGRVHGFHKLIRFFVGMGRRFIITTYTFLITLRGVKFGLRVFLHYGLRGTVLAQRKFRPMFATGSYMTLTMVTWVLTSIPGVPRVHITTFVYYCIFSRTTSCQQNFCMEYIFVMSSRLTKRGFMRGFFVPFGSFGH